MTADTCAPEPTGDLGPLEAEGCRVWRRLYFSLRNLQLFTVTLEAWPGPTWKVE